MPNMFVDWIRTSVITLAATSAVATAAPKLDLDRVTPVPDNEPVPIQDFFRPQLLTDPSLNPAGTHIAALITGDRDKYRLLVYNIAKQTFDTLAGVGDSDIYSYDWLTDDQIVFRLAQDKLWGVGLLGVDINHIKYPYPFLQWVGVSILSIPPNRRTEPLVQVSGLTSVSLRTAVKVRTDMRNGKFYNLRGASTNISVALDEIDKDNERRISVSYPVPKVGIPYGYMADKDGELEFAFTSDEGKLALLRFDAGRWVPCPVDLETVDVVGPGTKRGEIIVSTVREPGKPQALLLMDAATGAMGEVLIQDVAYDFNGYVYRHPVTNDLLGAVYSRNGPHVTWFTESHRVLQKLLDGYFPGLVVRILGTDNAEKMVLVRVSSDRQPAIYYWVNLETKQMGLFKSSAPWIDPKRMQPMSTVKFKTRDGRKLDGYLTLPAGATKANPPPLIVLAHGGPWSRDVWGFDPEAQFFASRGYAVLQPNYRGSTGYDWMFPLEDRWAFDKMHDDVTDATKAIVGSGLIDKNRIAIMGGSFGGYLALSGVTNEPTLYRCAVTMAGVFDWAMLIRDDKYYQHSSTNYARLVKKLGDPAKQADKFDAISPLRRVANIRVPVMVAHGKDDFVVDVSQSRKLISELERHKVLHESWLVGGEGHGMSFLKHRVELYSRIEAFLAKYMTPTAAPTAPTTAAAP